MLRKYDTQTRYIFAAINQSKEWRSWEEIDYRKCRVDIHLGSQNSFCCAIARRR